MIVILALLSALFFAIALILHLIGHGAAHYVTDFELGGLLALALYLAFAVPAVVLRRREQ